MDKELSIRDLILVKKAIEILKYLDISYDIDKLRKRPDICKEIVIYFDDKYIL